MTIFKKILKELRYLNYQKDIEKNNYLRDNETISVFHGFAQLNQALIAIKFGLSGKERADRRFSYEYGNNPKGLFVSADINTIIRSHFAGSGIIIQFSTKVSNLESPVWVGGRSYFVQGEYTKSFKDENEREEQRLKNRERDKLSNYKTISKSDRPELAQVLFDNLEHQALFIGHLNPNMIKYVWVNENLMINRKTSGSWKKMKQKDFIKKYFESNAKSKKQIYNYKTKSWEYNKPDYDDEYYRKEEKIFSPNDDFNLNKVNLYFKKHKFSIDSNEYTVFNLDTFLTRFYKNRIYQDYIDRLFWPKQIEQIEKL